MTGWTRPYLHIIINARLSGSLRLTPEGGAPAHWHPPQDTPLLITVYVTRYEKRDHLG